MISTTSRARRAIAAVALAAAATLIAPAPARAWEPQTTHAGLAEQAAAASKLHAKLRALGFDRGLYEPLTIPPADAPALLKTLELLDPSVGAAPDGRGRQYAIGWLIAGAVIADVGAAQHHFFDPATGKGLVPPSRSKLAINTPALPAGIAAPDWIVSKDNPLGLAGFVEQYAKAVRAKTPGERARHLAAALIAGGAVLHVLQDVGSPSHARGDGAAHLDRIGPDLDDVGSRFERVAALAFGRLGVPAASHVVSSPTLRGFFTTAEGSGLADVTAARWFSAHTLPRALRIGAQDRRGELSEQLRASLVRPAPVLPPRLNLMVAGQAEGATLLDAAGVCLARYGVQHDVLSWSLDDDCLLAESEAILPEVAGYGAGLIDWLFRGSLDVEVKGGQVVVTARELGLGAGTLELFSEDAAGIRTPLTSAAVTAIAEGASVSATGNPAGAQRVVALFTGVDGAGETVVVAGTTAPAQAP